MEIDLIYFLLQDCILEKDILETVRKSSLCKKLKRMYDIEEDRIEKYVFAMMLSTLIS